MLQVMKNAIFLIFRVTLIATDIKKKFFSLIGVSCCMHRSMTEVATEAGMNLILELSMWNAK